MPGCKHWKDQADEGKEESAKMQRFLEKHSTEELRRYGEIAKHHEAGIPLTVEEQEFLTSMEAKYADNST